MNVYERERQADAFLDFHRRRSGSWEWSFDAWAASKDFMPRDRAGIRRLVEAEMIGRGRSVITDLDYVPPAARARRRRAPR